ncbi:MAG: hypothetical protein WCH05_00560 [Chlorobiaceae bacterium]
MNIRRLSLPGGRVVLGLFLLLSGCDSADDARLSPAQFYRQASSLALRGEYGKAIDSYNKGLATDKLKPATPGSIRALNEKRVLEGMTGEYYQALHSASLLEKMPPGSLSDSLKSAILFDKASWLRELGSFSEAAAALEHLPSPSSACRFELAGLYRMRGDYPKAVGIYRLFTGNEHDPVLKIRAWAGLLQCAVAEPRVVAQKPDIIAAKIAAESGRVLAMEGSAVERIRALREAAASLRLLEKQQRNASYLLFRAVSLAQEAKNPLLLQILRLESNAVIVRKSDPFREASEYFRGRNMQYAQAAALFMLAGSGTVEEAERIAALQKGFSVARNFAPPYPTGELLQLEKHSGRLLGGLLLRKSRIFELFNAFEQSGSLELQRAIYRYGRALLLPKGHEALDAEVSRLQHEISGLLQRKADIFIRAEGYEKNRLADQALNIKRGRLLSLLSEVRALNPVAADAMQMTPITLQSVQNELMDDEAIVKPIIADSLSGVMLIGRRQLQLEAGGATYDSLRTPLSEAAAFRREIAARKAGGQPVSALQERLSKAFYDPIAASLGRYRRIVVISEDLFPWNILSASRRPMPERRYAFLQSIKEFSLFRLNQREERSAPRTIFYRAENVEGARIAKLISPDDRVCLLWKSFSGAELEALLREAGEKSAGRDAWQYVSFYGRE